MEKAMTNHSAANKSQGGFKKFLTSKIFKWIMILALEFVSLTICGNLISATNGDIMNNSKPLLIYYGICIVLSLGALGNIGRSKKEAEREQHKGVIRIMSESQYNYEKTDNAAGHAAFMLVASIIVAPFAAPVTVGSMIHKAICAFC